MIGRTLAHYEILEKIGAGGMGVVYRARDTNLRREGAIKVVGEQAQLDASARGRLLREARTASALNHPNICTIYEAGEAGGETYIAMELVEGQPLSAMIARGGLPVEVAIRYAVQVAGALAHAHDRGVVHRDLKCANVMVTPEGRPKVLDFGLAKRAMEAPGEGEATRTEDPLTKAGAIAGTLAYMAPEVLSGHRADARSDLWALGVMLYHSLTGTLPFRGKTTFEITSAILRDPVALPQSGATPQSLSPILQRLLAKQPDERYQRAGEVRAALEAIQPGAQVVPPSRRNWFWVAAAVTVTAAAVWVGIDRQRNPTAPPGGPRLSDGNRPSKNPEANAYYEKAMLFAGGGARHDPMQMRRMMERALELDAKFAAARAMIAFTQMLLAMSGASKDQGLLYNAQEQARQALKDDPDCSLAHSVLAGTYLIQGRKELVLEEVTKALLTNEADPAVHTWVPMLHQMNGDYGQALSEAKRITARWPLFWPARLGLGEVLREQGDIAGAIREQEGILEQDTQLGAALACLALAHMDAGELLKARQALERMRPAERPALRGRLAWARLLALEHKRAEALREMDSDVREFAGAQIFSPTAVAEIYAVLGDTPKALDWMDRGIRMGDAREDWFRRNPHFATIRDHPRFQQMLASVAYQRKQRPPATSTTR